MHSERDRGNNMEELKRLAQARDMVEDYWLQVLKEDSKIADNMRDVWASQQSGAEWRR